MKLKLLALAALTVVTANSFAIDIADRNELRALEQRVDELSKSHSGVLAKQAEVSQSLNQTTQPAQRSLTPDWVLNIPESEKAILALGIGQSMNEQLAYDKARMYAERRLVEITNSEIESLTKSYVLEHDESLTETTEMVVQKTANGRLVGTKRLNTHTEYDGRRYKVYMLVALPLDENNPLRKDREAQQAKREAEIHQQRAFEELQRQTKERKERELAEQQRRENQLKRSIPGPVSPSIPAEQTLGPGEKIMVPEQSTVNVTPEPPNGVVITPITGGPAAPVSNLTPTQKQSIGADITDPVVREKIAQALEKPNAVYLKDTIR